MSANGQLADAELAPIPGGRLRKDAAQAFNAMCAEQPVAIRDSYRPLGHPGDLDKGIWSQWAAWERYQRGGSLAALPGTSNHGWGTATDLATPQDRTTLDRIGAKYGWSKAWSDAPCVPLGTRILTRRGFVAYDDLRESDETVGYDTASGQSAWTPILAVQRFPDAPTVAYEHSTVRLVCTPNHKWIVGPRDGGPGRLMSLHRMFAGDSQRRVVLAAAGAEGGGLSITDDEAALLGWALTDGSIYRFTNSRGDRAFTRIYQRKQVGVEAVATLMRSFEHRHDSEYATSNGESTHMWYVGRGTFSPILHRSRLDELGVVEFVLALSSSQRAAFLDAVRLAEGGQGNGLVNIAQQEPDRREAFAIAAALEGHFVTLGPRTVNLRREAVRGNSLVELELGEQDVWCPVTGLGSWTAEQDGQVFITGNSEWWHILYQPGHYMPVIPEGAMSIAVATNQSGKLEVFVQKDSGEVVHTAQDHKTGEWWKDSKGQPVWLSLGNPGK